MRSYNKAFARYYSELTDHKDYDFECEELLKRLRRQGLPGREKLLSVGCGIGLHERRLALHFNRVRGIDISKAMVERGNDFSNPKNLRLESISISELKERGFDAVVSLFNVLNCIKSKKTVEKFFLDVRRVTKANGIFAFELWNKYAINQSPPVKKTRVYQKDGVVLKRVCTPKIVSERHVELVYDVDGVDDGRGINFKSVHQIYMHSIDEIEECLVSCGFSYINWYPALSEILDDRPQESRMLMCVCHRK